MALIHTRFVVIAPGLVEEKAQRKIKLLVKRKLKKSTA